MVERLEQELCVPLRSHGAYEPLPSLPESDGAPVFPDLVGGESVEWAAIRNLDSFLTRLYRYWLEKGWVVIVASRLLNLAALAFTIAFSGFLLLGVDWGALHAQCLMAHDRSSCDILSVAVHAHPLRGRSPALVVLAGAYVALTLLYFAWSAAAAVAELRGVLDTRHFVANKLGISERQLRMMTWSEVVHRIVLVQRHARLCAVRDLDEHDIVSRIMRKDNYLIGMLNAGVLALHIPAGPLARWGLGVRRRFVLTKTLEWNLYWAVLDPMWDEDGVYVRREWLEDEAGLRRRLRVLAALNLAVSPFLLLFLVIYFAMKNAERFYHSPGTLGSRRWSALAKWRLRELNELPHYVTHRLAASHEAAVRYLAQFPSPLITQVARFVSFVAGSFAALLLGLSLLDENLLEVPLAGRNVVWWLALTGILLAASRAFIADVAPALDPERAMAELVAHTHHLPRHWRGRAHTAEVQGAVSALFPLKVLAFAEELCSVVVTPFILGCSLPKCAGAILAFVREHTVRVDGVGDVCSLAAFDFDRHGNPKYGAPGAPRSKWARSRQGKMEKSFLTFVATYPTWAPPPAGRQMLAALSQHTDAAAAWGWGGRVAGGGGWAGTSRFSVGPYGPAPQPPPSTWQPQHAKPPPQQQYQPPSVPNGAVPAAAPKQPPRPAAPGAVPLAAGAWDGEDPQPGHSSLVDASDPFGPLGPLGPSGKDQRQRLQQQQQQQQQHSPQQQAGAAPMHPHHMLQVWPSTLYPGGPNAAAMLPNLGFSGGGDSAGAPACEGAWSSVHPGASNGWVPPAAGLAAGAPQSVEVAVECGSGGSGGGGAAAGSDLLPANEAHDLAGRIAASHLLLQSFYESRDETVQHRQANTAHARSALLQRALEGGALSVAPFLAASVAAHAGMPHNLHHSMPAPPHSPLGRSGLYH